MATIDERDRELARSLPDAFHLGWVSPEPPEAFLGRLVARHWPTVALEARRELVDLLIALFEPLTSYPHQRVHQDLRVRCEALIVAWLARERPEPPSDDVPERRFRPSAFGSR